MTLYEADLQLAVARHLRWMPDRITLDADSLLMEGWALGVWDAQTQCRFWSMAWILTYWNGRCPRPTC